MSSKDMDFIFDMETGDPDDVLTLALLGGHPDVRLIGVTVTPGTPHQVGVVRHILNRLGLSIPVGAYNLDHQPSGRGDVNCVSAWHYRTFGDIPPSRDAEPGWRVLERLLSSETTLVTGAPLKNLGRLMQEMGVRLYDRTPELGRLFIQGGFAGEGVVPYEKQLPKFKGKRTCPTFNLNGDPDAALRVLDHAYWFQDLRLVSKNVCHGVVYDKAMHERVRAVRDPHPGLRLILQGMETYLERRPEGKKFHDPLAACCALDPSIATWAEVEMFREQGEWGARLAPGSRIRIITDYDHEKFLGVLTKTGSG